MSNKPTSRPPADSNRDDDFAAFRDAMRDVVPHTPIREAPPTQSLDARARQREADEADALRESLETIPDDVLIAAGDILEYRAQGFPESVFRRLKRGQFHIRDELDLHGLNARDARLAVRDFLQRCRGDDRRCVRIIHGKGLRSTGDGPVLKRALDGWLRRRAEVLAFTSARRAHGGAGAVYVLLRRAD